jgi:group I intron endonuclease
MRLDAIRHLRKPEEVHGYIYGLKSPSGKWYIGQTSHNKLFSYLSFHYETDIGGGRPKIKNAILKYGIDAFEFFVLDIAPDLASLNELEKQYIIYYNAIENGYNCTEGGDSSPTFLGRRHSEETKIKMSLSGKGRKHTDEFKDNIGKRSIGNKYSQGRVLSNESLEKNRLSNCEFKYQILSPSGDVFETFSLNYFCKINNLRQNKMSEHGKYKGWKVLSKERINP